MKIIKLLLTLTLSLSFQISWGQITLDNIVSNTYILSGTFYPVELDNNETKYVFVDTTTNKFSLYNMNFTPYLSNIALPGTYNYNYMVMYVSRRLFDCDSTNIEYVYSAPFTPASTFKIFRTNGTLIFSLDSAVGLYSIGALGGSNDIRPIRKTSAGTKMFLGKWNPAWTGSNLKTYVYSLCGQLPEGYTELFNPLISSAKVYPNPTSTQLTFEISLPSNIKKYDLTIYDTSGKEIKKEQSVTTTKHDLDVSNFNNGVYFYSLTNEGKTIYTGKFVMTK